MPVDVRPSFDEVYASTAELVWVNARRFGVRIDAVEDVVQDVFVIVHRRLAEFDGRSSIKTWVFGIMMNVIRDRRRRFRRKEAHEDSDSGSRVIAAQSLPDDQAAANEALRIVQLILDDMSEELREVLILSQLEGMTAPEIAELTGANVNTIYWRIRTAKHHFDEAYRRMCNPIGETP